MNFIVALVVIALSAGAIFAGYRFVKKRRGASFIHEREEYLKQIDQVSNELKELLKYVESYTSRQQYESVASRATSKKASLDQEKQSLKGLESRLDSAQANVEQKEAHQQELKTAKEEDEEQLSKLLDNYTQFSEEAMKLEQQLAESMKNLDSIIGELKMTDEQKAYLTELSESLSTAGSNLRNILMDYQTVKERLELLRSQHEDLEEEYTKLVEQQLGE